MPDNDDKTVLPKNAWAVVFEPGEGIYLLTPNADDDSIVPAEALALSAAFIKMTNDHEFYQSLIDFFCDVDGNLKEETDDEPPGSLPH